jgi:hypothetical protein
MYNSEKGEGRREKGRTAPPSTALRTGFETRSSRAPCPEEDAAALRDALLCLS